VKSVKYLSVGELVGRIEESDPETPFLWSEEFVSAVDYDDLKRQLAEAHKHCEHRCEFDAAHIEDLRAEREEAEARAVKAEREVSLLSSGEPMSAAALREHVRLETLAVTKRAEKAERERDALADTAHDAWFDGWIACEDAAGIDMSHVRAETYARRIRDARKGAG
jgi:cell division protein FtsB